MLICFNLMFITLFLILWNDLQLFTFIIPLKYDITAFNNSLSLYIVNLVI